MALVSILSLVAVMVAVHPAAVGFRRIISWGPLVEVGRRSYGLYLWSWPIFVIVGATTGSITAFLWAMFLTIIVAEASYRFLESPVRQGIIGRWWSDRASITYWPIAGGVMLVGILALFYVNVDAFNRFEGGDDVVFELDEATTNPATDAVADSSTSDESATASPSDAVAATVADTVVDTVPPIVPATSARLAIVGDWPANARLAINLPDGIDDVFPTVVNGSVDGCSVYDSGSVPQRREVREQLLDL